MSAPVSFLHGRVTLHEGDCRKSVAGLPDASIDAVVTDPPYALVSIQQRFGGPNAAATKDGDVYARSSAGFMGKQWDTGETAFAATFWAEILRVLKPGGHIVAFGGTRSHHRMWCAIEDAGFEIRDSLLDLFDLDPVIRAFVASLDEWQRQTFLYILDQLGPGGMLAWTYGTGFPKSHDAGGGWGTAVKPAWEPIVLARKALVGTVATNRAQHGTGALNIDGCRMEAEPGRCWRQPSGLGTSLSGSTDGSLRNEIEDRSHLGRWPANIVHDGSDEVLACFPDETGNGFRARPSSASVSGYSGGLDGVRGARGHDDTGSAARFFYSAKADADDRIGSKHPTVKPVDLMRWLVRLVTPPGGVVLDPFAGTGTTGEAAWREGFSAVLCEREAEYRADVARRMALAEAGPATRRLEAAKARGRAEKAAPLFDLLGGDAP